MQFGLIGYPLEHSFSKKYFEKKFNAMGRIDLSFNLFTLDTLDNFKNTLIQNHELIGLNVTIPYKETIIPLLNEVEETAREVGAVNTISIIRE